ncbi:MAG: S1-like domain-containing RNA-binding protein, partial [Bacteroidetes bacterium]|nr:S1-like domain-containing RNA-binding protein [Bacteroidota bacterium]
MITLGIQNKLKIERFTPPGAFLSDEQGNEVLLPTKYLPSQAKTDDWIDVFVYKDSEDRIISTTLDPYVRLHEFAYLKVKDVNKFGAFLDWGVEKDLLVPFRQQKQTMQPGKRYLIYLYLDQLTNRLAATSKLHRYFEKENIDLEEQQEVDLLIAERSDLGLNVVVNNKYRGLIFENELFHKLLMGDRIKGYVKKIRSDNKIDISLHKSGMEHLEWGVVKILDILHKRDGFLPLHDKSSPEE